MSGLHYGAAMVAPNPDQPEQIASTYQFRAFTDRLDTDEIPVSKGPSTTVVLVAGVLVVALVVGVVAVLLTM